MIEKQVLSRHFETESLLDIILDRFPIYLAHISKDLIIQYISKSFAAWFGFSKEELIGLHIKEIISKDQRDKINQYINEVLTGKTVTFDSEAIDRNNAVIQITTTYLPFYENQNEIAGFSVFIKSQSVNSNALEEYIINEQKALYQIEELDRFFNMTLDLLCIADTDGYFIKLNPEWERSLGYKVDDLEGKYFIDMVHPDDEAATFKVLKDLMNEKSVCNFINRFLCKDNSYKWIEWRSNSYGNRIFAAARDITQRMEYEKAIEDSQKLLKESNATKDKLFSIIAHDLKSPFSAILGYTEFLRSGLIQNNLEDINEIVENLYISSKSAYDLLENLLDWSRMQSGAFKFQVRSLLLDEIIDQPVTLVQSVANAKNITIIANYPNNVRILADVNLTNTILRNLLSNAVKFSYQNNKVLLNAIVIDSEVNIKVTDNGIGIRPESLKTLFMPDLQETTHGTLNEKGTGLGLMLCKDFIEKQGGKLTVESEIGKGSTFTFSLPLFK
jgi:PAS domain S-box-containing protein